ncbi:MAG TPA: thiamine phosphate synthase [Thermoanaerobaculia bacterium]|nr:thiamine phosphate synthase [Thermoanaerobaculia bacterium]
MRERATQRGLAQVPKLYAIVDQAAFGSLALDDVAEELAQAGVVWIQLRAKSLSDRDFFRVVEATVRRLEGSPSRLWINDRADIAACFGAEVAGVHLGQRDLPPQAARRVLAETAWIGASSHDLGQAAAVAADSAVDLVAFGPVFATRSKQEADPVVGLETLRLARRLVDKPLVAIGGIDASNARAVLEAGADAIAVIGALARGGRPGTAARELLVALG